MEPPALVPGDEASREIAAAAEPAADVPPDNELVIGLVAASGVDLSSVADELGARLAPFNYESRDLHLSDTLLSFDWGEPLPDHPYDERTWALMDAGDALRRRWDLNEAMALLAVSRVSLERARVTDDETLAASRVAYVVRSLKRPEEVERLRQIYGDRFILIGVSGTEKERLELLQTKISRSRTRPLDPTPVHPPEALIERDEKGLPGDGGFGQDVTGTFHRADCFIEQGDLMSEQLERFLDLLFGDPKRSPLPPEFGMFQATAAARRSAEMGRQVGAAVCTSDGSVIAVGANEVPKAGGGFYWEGDEGDARDVTLGFDASKTHRKELAAEVEAELRASGVLSAGADAETVREAIEESPMSDILEFVRAVHAEMAALTDAARRGVSVQGTTLYVTTFPCHHCARHIIASGIKRVVYVAPYPKSRAEELHRDALVLGKPAKNDNRVGFEPFVGLGPRRYLHLFDYKKRKKTDGSLAEFDRLHAEPRLGDRDPLDLRSQRLPYIDREQKALKLLKAHEERTGFAMKRDLGAR